MNTELAYKSVVLHMAYQAGDVTYAGGVPSVDVTRCKHDVCNMAVMSQDTDYWEKSELKDSQTDTMQIET